MIGRYMILIFGGTTEGRQVTELLDRVGKPYYYSTRGNLQQIACSHGIRLTGGMDAGEMTAFCRTEKIRLLIDAAHPFAEQLHRNIAEVSCGLDIPVIRYERIYPPRDKNCIWCDTYDEAIRWLNEQGCRSLLALSGVQTIKKLRPYWEKHLTWFRILNRKDSVGLAEQQGFPASRLIFYEEGEDEAVLLERLQPAAVLTKESGTTGFFEEKIRPALQRQIPVLVIKRPVLPESFYVVTGQHGLRYRIERLLPGYFPLKSGFTTGSCACAAAKAALTTLLTGKILKQVTIRLPGGEDVVLPVAATEKRERQVCCSVIKDAGDDPDVTQGCEIRVSVSLTTCPGIHFRAGKGVGRVTLPGLGLSVGEPAINPVPRQMMIAETEALLTQLQVDSGVEIRIAVPGGEELALKTFNPKLGITGGISIIGTSGVVKPFSSEAFIETIRREIRMARALGCRHLVINSGAKSERILKERFPELLPQAFVHYGNYIGETLRIAGEEQMEKVTLGIMIGKAVKLAEGHADTHSRQVVMNREFIADLAFQAGCTDEVCEAVRRMSLARELWQLLPAGHVFFTLLLEKCREVCRPFLRHGELEILLIPEDYSSVIS